jgi:DNA mismatch endonuclease (patch repair protein)
MPPPRLPTTPSRAAQMSRIRGRDTGPEVHLQQALADLGTHALVNQPLRLPTEPRALKPDLTFPDQGLVVFMDGCQWHGCPEHYVRPRTNTTHWAHRLRAAVERDRRQTAALREAGWRVLRFWEHRVEEALADVALEIIAAVEGAPVEAEQRWCVVAAEPVEGTERLETRRLVSLLDPWEERVEQRERSTRKWRRSTQPTPNA